MTVTHLPSPSLGVQLLRQLPVALPVLAALAAIGYRPLLILSTDGVAALLVVLAAWGLGAHPTRWLLSYDRSAARRAMVSIAIGLGLLSFIVLGLGVAGMLSRVTAWGILGVGIGLLVERVYAGARRPSIEARRAPLVEPMPPIAPIVGLALAMLTLAVPLTIGLFGASLPPSVLWPQEANGYDALEYHLQCPREYFDARRITFLEHNVYASFPQQVEMLYLLLMHVFNDAHNAALSAQLLHTLLGVLTVCAVAAWTQPGPLRYAAAIAAGSSPWLAYAGSLAYVECGMLFFSAVSGGLMLQLIRRDKPSAGRMAALCGVCAGLAAGCKYTALGLTVLPVGLALLICVQARLRRRLGVVGMYALGAAAAFAPWAIRNTAWTGNPVYPFAYSIFGGRGWSGEQDAQWNRGHVLGGEKSRLAARLKTAAEELVGRVHVLPQRPTDVGLQRGSEWRFSRFGPAMLLIGAIALLLGPRRDSLALGIWIATILGVWILATHIPGRFAMPLIVPLALAIGNVAPLKFLRPPKSDYLAWGVLGAATLASIAGGWLLSRDLSRAEESFRRRTDLPLETVIGATEDFREASPLGGVLPGKARAWLVGEAAVFYTPHVARYTVVFNRDPWVEHAESATPADSVDWLARRGITHVVFSWSEIDRLRGTYGFSPRVTPVWVSDLVAAGLRPVLPESRHDVPNLPPGMEIYEVPAVNR